MNMKAWRTVFGALLLGLVLGGCTSPTGLRAVITTDPHPPSGPYPLFVTFDGTKSVGQIEEWNWVIFQEGREEALATLSGPVVAYEFAERGKYQVYLEVRSGMHFHQTSVEVDVRSKLPTARFTADPFPEVQEGHTVTFDASSSFDPDGEIKTYVWSFGDGFWEETTSPKVSHKYTAAGEYRVQLVVEDDYGDRSLPAELRIRVVPKGCGSCG